MTEWIFASARTISSICIVVGFEKEPPTMHEYRCYFLDYRYYVVDQRTIVCESDDAACTFANRLLAAHVYPAIEVWEGQRQIHGARKLPAL